MEQAILNHFHIHGPRHIPKPHVCRECGRSFRTEKALKIHEAKHEREDERLIIMALRYLAPAEAAAIREAASKSPEKALEILSSSRSLKIAAIASAIARRPHLLKLLRDLASTLAAG